MTAHATAHATTSLTGPGPVPGSPVPGPVARLRGRLRQRRFPEEFRIPPGHLYPEPALARPANTVPAATAVTSAAAAGQPGAEGSGLPDPALADLATHLWRLARKLGPGRADGAASAGQRLAGRHLRAAREALTEAGVETQDHDGSDFDIGLSLHVLAYQPTPGAARETVLETIRPSVYRDGRQIQIGQVIVAQPESARPAGARPAGVQPENAQPEGEQEHGPRDR